MMRPDRRVPSPVPATAGRRQWLPAWLALACMVAGGSAWHGPAATAGGTSRDLSPAEQRQLVHLVRQDCGSCHGMTLKGGLGKPLLPETLAGRDAETLAAIILDGIPGTPMPPWRGLLSERQARWIARRLKEGFPHEAP